MAIPSTNPFDQLPVAIAILDETGLVREVNSHLAAALGHEVASLQGQPLVKLMTRAAALLYQSCIWPNLMEAGLVQNLTIQLQHAQGQRIDAMFNASRGQGPDGEGLVRCVFMDLKAHGHIEGLLLRAKRAADEAPGLLFQLRQAASRGQRRFVYVTEAVRPLFGLSPRQVLEDPQALWQRVHGDDRPALKAALEASAYNMKPWRSEFRRLTNEPDAPAWTEVQATPHRESDGAVVWSGYIADVSDRKALETGLRDKAAAEYASQAKSDFLARMSHELRTPLNGILGFVQLLQIQSPGNLRDDQVDKIGYIDTAGHNLLNLINEVLEISRIEAGHVPVDIDDVDLDQIVQNSVRMAEPLAAQRRVRLVRAGQEHLCVHADPQRLGQILLNLLSNAVKYGPAEGQVTVAVQTMDQAPRGNGNGTGDTEVAISVKDQGPGLSPAQQAQLFQPFNRLGAERGQVEGTGLGLVITRGLAELMGGRLQVCSLPGQGACFTVCLKLATGRCGVPGCSAHDPQAANMATAEASPDGAVASSARQRLLYVEDNPVNALLMTSLFERSPDFELEVVDSGAKAMARLRTERHWPDGLLLDMHLPDTDGITLMQSLKALPGWHGQPVIAISADAMPEGIGQAIEAGFTDYWTKPLNITYVQHMLRNLLRPTAPH